MGDLDARALARHARWRPPVQQQLHRRGAAHLAVNRHLTPQVARAVAAGATPAHLAALLRAQGEPGEEIWAAAMTRLGQLLADPEAAAAVPHSDLDAAVRTVLLSCLSEGTARELAARVPDGPLPGTAEVLLALGVRPAAQLRHADLRQALYWLASPAAAEYDDDAVGAALAGRDPATGAPATDAAAALLLLRPGLRRYADRVPALEQASDTLAADGHHAEWATAAGGWWARRRTRAKALASLRHGVHNANTWMLRRARTWAVAQAALAGGWNTRQRATLAELLQATSPDLLAWALPVVGAALGVDLGVPARARVTWARLRVELGGPFPDLPGLAATRLHETGLAAELLEALADPDPGVEADRWVVALRLADTFTGTVAQLAAVARQVAVPTG